MVFKIGNYVLPLSGREKKRTNLRIQVCVVPARCKYKPDFSSDRGDFRFDKQAGVIRCSKIFNESSSSFEMTYTAYFLETETCHLENWFMSENDI